MRQAKKPPPINSAETQPSFHLLAKPTFLFVATSLFLAIVDTFFLPDYLISYLSFIQRTLTLPICLWGNLIGVVLVFSFFLAGLKYLYSWRPTRDRKAIKLFCLAAVVVGTVAYSFWLAGYAFSGDYISASPFRTYFVVGSTIVIGALFLFYFAFAVYRIDRTWFSKTIGLSCLILAGLGVWINQEMYPDEYGPLHTLVSVWSILLSLLGFGELIRSTRFTRTFSRWKVVLVGAGAVLLAVSVVVFLASNAMYSWIIWDATGLSRHVTVRLELAGDDEIQQGDQGNGQLSLVLKPDLNHFKVQAERTHRAAEPAPHIVLFVIDNVQADHVGAYGYRRKPTTPNIDVLAKTGTVFNNAYVSFPQTRYFSCALLLGQYFSFFTTHHFPPSFVLSSVPRLLKNRNYLIFVRAWFEGGMKSGFRPADYKIDQYFRPLYQNHPLNNTGLVDWFKLSDQERLDKVAAHLDAANKKGVPALIWIHAIRPHWEGKTIQYKASKKFPFGNGLTDLYDSAIAATDDWYGRMKKMIEKRSGDRKVAWIVASDHGAGMGRYKGGSGKSLYDVHTRVPTIIAAPGFGANQVSTLVDVPLDLAATVLDLAGIPVPKTYQGISLLPLMSGLEEKDRVVALRYNKKSGAVYRHWKLIKKKTAFSLFDLSRNPREYRNVADKHPTLVKRLSDVVKSASRERFRIQEKK